MKNSLAVVALSVALVGVASAEAVAPKSAPVSDVMTLVAADGASSGGGYTREALLSMSTAELWALVGLSLITVAAFDEITKDPKRPASP